MEETRSRILDFLAKENVEVAYFMEGYIRDFIEELTTIALKIPDTEFEKWQYFMKRLNECGHIASYTYIDGIFKIAFTASNDEFDRVILVNDLKTFYEKLQKRYFTVSPVVKSHSLLVKPTHRCNLNCLYCYDKHFRDTIKDDMSMETLDRVLELAANYTEKLRLIWHGGEPTMVGMEWYIEAYQKVISKYPMLDFEFQLMSNGLNIDDGWLELFKSFHINPGISYDAFAQEKHRKLGTVNDFYSVDDQMRTTPGLRDILKVDLEKTLQYAKDICFSPGWQKGIGIITVITRENFRSMINMYNHYKEKGINFSYNVVFKTQRSCESELLLDPFEYALEFLKYFEFWLHDPGGVYERSAVEALARVIGSNKVSCTYTDCRCEWLGINPLGDIYPCDRYVSERYKIGNVAEFNSIVDIYKSPAFLNYYNEIQTRFNSRCSKCGLWDSCHGGCNATAIETTGDARSMDDNYCKAVRLIFLGVYDMLRDTDIVHDRNLNPYARQELVQNCFYSVKDIKRYMAENGINFELVYDPVDLVHCSEYEVFRGINYYKGRERRLNLHADFIHACSEEAVETNRKKRDEALKEYLKGVALYVARSIEFPAVCSGGHI